MHEPVKQGLEEFLAGRSGIEPHEDFHRHLAECGGCRSMVDEMRAQQSLLRELRPAEIQSPAPGFYARVMERIEERIEAQAASNSFWSIFLEPSFGRRLLYASLALFVVLGSAVWQTTGVSPIDQANPVHIMAGSDLPVATGEDPGRDREVVLTNLVSLSDGGAAPDSLPISSD